MLTPPGSIDGPEIDVAPVPDSVNALATTIGFAGKPAVAVYATVTPIPVSVEFQIFVKVAEDSFPVAFLHQSATLQSDPTTNSPILFQPEYVSTPVVVVFVTNQAKTKSPATTPAGKLSVHDADAVPIAVCVADPRSDIAILVRLTS